MKYSRLLLTASCTMTLGVLSSNIPAHADSGFQSMSQEDFDHGKARYNTLTKQAPKYVAAGLTGLMIQSPNPKLAKAEKQAGLNAGQLENGDQEAKYLEVASTVTGDFTNMKDLYEAVGNTNYEKDYRYSQSISKKLSANPNADVQPDYRIFSAYTYTPSYFYNAEYDGIVVNINGKYSIGNHKSSFDRQLFVNNQGKIQLYPQGNNVG